MGCGLLGQMYDFRFVQLLKNLKNEKFWVFMCSLISIIAFCFCVLRDGHPI